ncbi:MAG: SRPBCC domain-containing protein [Sphingobacteriales bacterium]|nr:MAG: SRPBCC domain-containing protein [Sphingobacteriales bacterium]
MKKLRFNIEINAPASKVFQAIIDDKMYREWTSEFSPSSFFRGSWNKGDKIYFVGTGEDGKEGGMIATVVENIPNKQISLRHLGILDGKDEITSGPKVEGWVNAMEEYFFNEQNGITSFDVAVDTKSEFKDYFENTWPKALNKLKEIAER